MFKKLIALFSAVILMLSANTFSVSANNIEKESENKIKITFVEKASPKSIISFISDNNVDIESFTVEAICGSETLTSGYIVNESAAFDVLWNDFITKQTALLSESMRNNRSANSVSSMNTMLNALNTNNIQISVISNSSNSLDAKTLSAYNIVDETNLIEASSRSEQKIIENKTRSTSASNWLPSSGHAGAWNSQNVLDATYMEVWYRWNTAAELSTLTNDDDSTLEADLVFYNYDGSAISTAWYDGNYTYTTNQPRPYQDTQAFDDEDEAVFSIGCSDASSLSAGVDYYWAAYGNQTGSSGCKAKVNFQRGHRILNSLYEETWNIYGDETVKVVAFNEWNTATSPYAYF